MKKQLDHQLTKTGVSKELISVLIPLVVSVSCAFLWAVASASATLAILVVTIDLRHVYKAYLFDDRYGRTYKRLVWFRLTGIVISMTAAIASMLLLR